MNAIGIYIGNDAKDILIAMMGKMENMVIQINSKSIT